MNIAFLPQDRRKFKKKKLNKNLKNFNEDSFWIATILRIPPENDYYLYMTNPKTTYALIHKLEGNWRNNIEESIKAAFRREFETLRERGVDIGNYDKFLEKIEFTTIPPQYLDTVENFKLSTQNYMNFYWSEEIPREFFVTELALDALNWYTNKNHEFSIETETPLDRIKKVFENYHDSVERNEVPFKENKSALKMPVFTTITNIENLDDLGDRQILVYDEEFLVFKEPQKRNFRKFIKASRKLERFLRTRDMTKASERDMNRLKSLMAQGDKYISYRPSPFSGEYKDLGIPDVLPDKTVFEFLITLDTGVYLAKRRVAVPANMTFTDFDKLMSHLFRWGGFPYHLSEFIFPFEYNPEGLDASEVLIWQEEDLPSKPYLLPADINYKDIHDPFRNVIHTDIKSKTLKDYFPKFQTAQYRYDFGDNWYHSIELVGIHNQEDYGKELPYLIDSAGVAPLDDLGGVERFYNLLNCIGEEMGEENFQRFGNDWAEEREFYLKTPCSLAPLFRGKYN